MTDAPEDSVVATEEGWRRFDIERRAAPWLRGPFELDAPSWQVLSRYLLTTFGNVASDLEQIQLAVPVHVGGRVFQPGTYVKERGDAFSD